VILSLAEDRRIAARVRKGILRDMSAENDEQWQEAVQQHINTVQAFVDTALKLSSDTWLRPVEEGKWSPAEITEHLKMVYVASLRELNGGLGIKIRSSKFLQRLLRFLILPRILKTGKFPQGAKAPHEIRPGKVTEDRSAALAEFTSLAAEFQSAVTKQGTEANLSHHVFGRLSAMEGLRLLTLHITHHQRQLT
jgi:hypothetical protein